MIISRTPFRISFFGGGSDFSEHFCDHGGMVISCAINKYCYLNVRKLPPFFTHKHRVVYSKIENVIDAAEIEHPSVKAVLQYLQPDCGISILHDGDIPARSGVGSSSAFTVGLLNAMYALFNKEKSSKFLAETAIYIEQELIKETVGCQDQICCAYGGFNTISFLEDGGFEVNPVNVCEDRLQNFKDHLLLIYTGISRISSEVAKEQKSNIKENSERLKELTAYAKEAKSIVCSGRDLKEFGELLHHSWKIKRNLSKRISSNELDAIYQTALDHGAYGGKLLGAGAGGFMLFFAAPEKHSAIKAAFSKLLYVPFDFDMEGSKIIFNTNSQEC